MRFYTQSHNFYCGIDLHARSMYLCVLDRDGKIVLHHNMASAPEPFLLAIEAYRGNLIVGVECIFCCTIESDRRASIGVWCSNAPLASSANPIPPETKSSNR